MKKLFTLFIAVATVATVSAQTSREEARRVVLGDRNDKSSEERDVVLGKRETTKYPTTRKSSSNSREARVDQVNREYNDKIRSIRNNNSLSKAEKDRIIRQLEIDRDRKIRQINGTYENGKNKRDKEYKNNKGKHKGWSKGKGNKHRDRDDDDDDD